MSVLISILYSPTYVQVLNTTFLKLLKDFKAIKKRKPRYSQHRPLEIPKGSGFATLNRSRFQTEATAFVFLNH